MFIFSLTDKDISLGSPLEVLDQGNQNKCEAYAATSIAEDYFRIKFNPDVTHDNALKISKWKAPTIEDVLESIRVFGLMPINGGDPLKYRCKGYTPLWGPRSTFNLIRGAIAKGIPVIFGLYWQQEWDSERQGIITSAFQNYKYFPHAVKACGQKLIDGRYNVQFLNSRGASVGDSGMFYINDDIEVYEPYVIHF